MIRKVDREKEETVDIYNPVTDTTYRIRKKQDVAEDNVSGCLLSQYENS